MARRRALHAASGQALEMLYAARLEEAYARLAYHYARTDNGAKAVAYLTRVGEKAARQSAHVEAISHLLQALELLQTLPATPERSQQELTLHIALGASLIATKGYAAAEVEQTYARARQLCRHLDGPHQLFPALHGLRNYYQVRAEYQTSRALDEQLLTLAQQAQDSACFWWHTAPWGRRCSSWAQQPRRTCTWHSGWCSTIPSDTAPLRSSMGRTLA